MMSLPMFYASHDAPGPGGTVHGYDRGGGDPILRCRRPAAVDSGHQMSCGNEDHD
jgi:hypothetical protein